MMFAGLFRLHGQGMRCGQVGNNYPSAAKGLGKFYPAARARMPLQKDVVIGYGACASILKVPGREGLILAEKTDGPAPELEESSNLADAGFLETHTMGNAGRPPGPAWRNCYSLR